ncbi:MAG: hypothetical protein WDZ35_01300 [Crocinitomicaceae bacterium]
MKKQHLIIAGLAFLMCLVAAYFGVSIQNANNNFLLTDLNEIDKIYYADINEVPKLSFLAAGITAPLILAILILEGMIIKKTQNRKVKNMAIGLMVATFIILLTDVYTLISPQKMDFSQWGYVWICLGLFLIAGNILSIFITRFSKDQQ